MIIILSLSHTHTHTHQQRTLQRTLQRNLADSEIADVDVNDLEALFPLENKTEPVDN